MGDQTWGEGGPAEVAGAPGSPASPPGAEPDYDAEIDKFLRINRIGVGGQAEIGDGSELAAKLMRQSFRSQATRQNIAALADSISEWAERYNIGRERMERGWGMFLSENLERWGVWITPRNVADQFDAWMRREVSGGGQEHQES